MKEFLEPHPNGNYAFIKAESSFHPSWIEIPDGADCLLEFDDGLEFYRNNKTEYFSDDFKAWKDIGAYKIGSAVRVVWQRSETEYLMQGKNGERFMVSVEQLKDSVSQPNQKTIDAMHEAEGILSKKHSHYRKSVKHLDFIDPYRIAQLYDLHPCADHIAKKALCTGKRGHKDLMRDIQDIIDTAERWKQMIQEDQNAI